MPDHKLRPCPFCLESEDVTLNESLFSYYVKCRLPLRLVKGATIGAVAVAVTVAHRRLRSCPRR